MAKTELKLKSTNAGTGQNITTTVGYVNPMANSQTLKTFGQKLNAFTTNNYVETDRVQTINVDTEEVVIPDTRPEPTLTLGAVRDGATNMKVIDITYDGDGKLCCAVGAGYNTNYSPFISQSEGVYRLSFASLAATNHAIVYVMSMPTDTYKTAIATKQL